MEEVYMSDQEISDSYKTYKITSFKLNESKKSGWINIEFDLNGETNEFNEDRCDSFIIYDHNGKIAFDSWYPEWMYLELVEYIKGKVAEST